VIIATHAYIDECGQIWSSDPSCQSDYFGPVLSKFIAGLNILMDATPNVFMTLNGHYCCGSYHETDQVEGRWELMFNEQGTGGVGASTVTTLTFNLTNDQVYVNTFDVSGIPVLLVGPSRQYTLTPVSAGCTSTSLTVGLYTTCTSLMMRILLPTSKVSWTMVDETGAVDFSSPTCSISRWSCAVNVTGTEAGTAEVHALYQTGASGAAASTDDILLTVKPVRTVLSVTYSSSHNGVWVLTATLRDSYSVEGEIINWSVMSGTKGATISFPATCTLSPGPSSGMSCSITVTGASKGSFGIEAVYAGDKNNLNSHAATKLRVT
jgi:hypothetical protein